MPAEIPLNELTAISPLDGRYWSDVQELSPYASESALIRARFEVEGEHIIQLSKEGVIRPLSGNEVDYLTNLGPNLTLEEVGKVKKIEDTTRHDVKAAEIAARDLLSGTSMEDLGRYWHILVTSRDIDNFAYRLLARRATDRVMIPALDGLVDHLMERGAESQGYRMVARTHGQDAVGTTIGKEIMVFADRINDGTRQLEQYRLKGKINGAVGNYNSFVAVWPEVDWIGYSERFAESLGFEPELVTTQINPYEDMIGMFQAYQRVNGAMLDLDQDTWRYISDHYFVLRAQKGAVGSSTMAQKVNPIQFENSAANLKVSSGLLETFGLWLPISRLQADLEDSSLIRNVGNALGHALLAYKNTLKGFQRVGFNVEASERDLGEAYEILAEPAQLILKVHEPGIDDPYELTRNAFQGRKVTERIWRGWVNDLPGVSDETRGKLVALRPENYIGLASELVHLAIQQIRVSRLRN